MLQITNFWSLVATLIDCSWNGLRRLMVQSMKLFRKDEVVVLELSIIINNFEV